jgi:hypothetical protein
MMHLIEIISMRPHKTLHKATNYAMQKPEQIKHAINYAMCKPSPWRVELVKRECQGGLDEVARHSTMPCASQHDRAWNRP